MDMTTESTTENRETLVAADRNDERRRAQAAAEDEWLAAHEFVSDLYREIKLLLSVEPSEQPLHLVRWTAKRMQFIADFAFENELGGFERELLQELRAVKRQKARRNRALGQEIK